jgi:hypothetical protein
VRFRRSPARPVTEPPADPLADPDFVAGLRPIPTGVPGEAPDWPAADLHGVRPDGSPVSVLLAGLDRPVLLVFLAVACDGCEVFWRGLAEGSVPEGVTPVAVTRGPGSADPSRVAALAGGFDGPVVMSDRAWTDHRVTGYPFLVLVDPSGRRILAEAVGFGWDDVASVLRTGLGG